MFSHTHTAPSERMKILISNYIFIPAYFTHFAFQFREERRNGTERRQKFHSHEHFPCEWQAAFITQSVRERLKRQNDRTKLNCVHSRRMLQSKRPSSYEQLRFDNNLQLEKLTLCCNNNTAKYKFSFRKSCALMEQTPPHFIPPKNNTVRTGDIFSL